ncbi:hypothetical protein B0H13DRAFT_2511144 [Mycena leptocephala]|nr:hypothetical protein B0H13DRAFT_2511144 [Mycena leptocephala]
MRFDYLTAPTSLSHPSPPRSWIYLSASWSRIIHRGSCADPQTSSSFTRAPVASGLANPCLIPARWCADDARAEPLHVLCALAFCVRAEAFGRRIHATLPSVPPFSPSPGCAHCGMSASRPPRRACGRYFSALAHLVRAHLVYLARLATKVDGDGEARRWGWECRWRWNAALALVTALIFPLVPALRVRRRRCRLGGTGRTGFKLRRYATHSQRGRSAGVARAPPSLSVVLAIPLLLRSWRSAYALRKGR